MKINELLLVAPNRIEKRSRTIDAIADDEVIGLKSTSIKFKNNIKFFVCISYLTTSTLGNASDFGSITGDTRSGGGGGGNAVRGVFGGGQADNQPTYTPQDEIHFITIATLGNSINFGDLNDAVSGLSACSSPTRVVFNGGYTPSQTNQLQYIQTMTTGNAIDFGDLTSNKARQAGCSNGHGGLG